MPELLTRTEFAKHVGLAKSRITQLVSEGLPIRKDGKINLDRGKRWIDNHLDPKRRQAAGRDASATGTVAGLRADKLKRENELLDLDLMLKKGALVDRREAEAAIEGRARFERDAWTGWAARTSQNLATELGCDPGDIYTVLDRLVREHLAELSTTPWNISDD